MRKFRCAVIGCGRIGCGFDDNSNDNIIRTHAGSYFKNHYTKLVALCDIDESKLQKYGKKYGVSGLYTKSSEMLAKENIDCVSICTLVDTHLDLVREVSKYNIKGIFLEKPISNSVQNAKKIIDICKKNRITLIIDHQRRFDPFYNSVRQLIQKKRIGDIQLINVYYGSGISNTGSHMFDLLRFIFGEIRSVKANFSKNESINNLDPNIDASLEFEDGTICRVQALDYRSYSLFEMDILGSLGRIKLNLISNEIEYFQVATKNSLVYKNLIPLKIRIKKSKQSAIQLGVQNLVSSIRSGNEPKCTGKDGYLSLELIVASIISSKLGRRIHLPLSNNNYKINSK